MIKYHADGTEDEEEDNPNSDIDVVMPAADNGGREEESAEEPKAPVSNPMPSTSPASNGKGKNK